MTKLIADQDCFCGGLLVPPTVVPAAKVVRPGTDYVCMTCGLPYAWVGTPPRLAPLTPRALDDE